jgi:hypothetical protein
LAAACRSTKHHCCAMRHRTRAVALLYDPLTHASSSALNAKQSTSCDLLVISFW